MRLILAVFDLCFLSRDKGRFKSIQKHQNVFKIFFLIVSLKFLVIQVNFNEYKIVK